MRLFEVFPSNRDAVSDTSQELRAYLFSYSFVEMVSFWG